MQKQPVVVTAGPFLQTVFSMSSWQRRKKWAVPEARETNPEQLFAAGYSACFIGAMKFVAGRDKLKMPEDASIEGVVGIGQIPNGFGIEVELRISLPGMDDAEAKKLIDEAHKVCPYSNATRGNIDVTLNRVD